MPDTTWGWLGNRLTGGSPTVFAGGLTRGTGDASVSVMSFWKRWIALLGALIGFVGWAEAAQVTLTAVADTSLWQRQTNHNLGGSDILPAGTIGADGPFRKSRMLVKFDLGAVPGGAVIESASVYFRVVRAPDPEKGSNNSRFTGRRALKPWGEGNKSYTDPQTPMTSTQQATAGEATWTHGFHGDDSTVWTPAGGDFEDDDFAEAAGFEFFMLAGADRDYVAALNPTGLQDLRDWIADSASNFGWLLKSESEHLGSTGRQIASREFATGTFRPQLTIVYSTSTPEPPVIQSIVRNAAQVTVRFTAQAGVVYLPQHRLLVHTGDWTNLASLGPVSSDGTLEFTDDLTGVDERFYRISVP